MTMSRVELAPEVADDLERIIDHLTEHDAKDIPQRIDEIVQAVSVLESNPCIGRSVRNDCRELVTGRRNRGYVALYRYISELDTVFVLALRAQKEAGFGR